MPYVPEPTHPVKISEEGTDEILSAQLQREFRSVQAADLLSNDTLLGAVPWKAFMMILDGQGGTTGGAANPTLPIIFDQYNINEAVGIIRTGEGVYVFTLLIAVLFEVPVLQRLYPDFNLLIPEINLDITAENTRVTITDSNLITGTFEMTVQQQETPPSGKAVWAPYDLRTPDRLWATGLLNFAGRAQDRQGSGGIQRFR